MTMRRLQGVLLIPLLALTLTQTASQGLAVSASPTVRVIPQGRQNNSDYAQSFNGSHVTNVSATTQATSCYRPEVSAVAFNDGPNNGYSGESACTSATTGEDTGASGPYATQVGSNPGYPMGAPQLVKGHSESDIRVDPTNSQHIIGSSKWFVSAEGYNHLLGFYESFDGGSNWSVQGHIPGYEGWTDNTDPVGAFDTNGNYYSLILPYQFFYKADGSHNFTVGRSQEPNPVQPAEAIAVSVHPKTTLPSATTANNWITTHNSHPDFVATYDSVGNEPDKQWITIDDNPNGHSAHPNRIYAMWVNFHLVTPVPYVSFADAHPDGTHSDWSAPQKLPTPPHQPQGVTYLLPHVAPDGTVYTTLTNFNPKQGHCCVSTFVDKSIDGGVTWSVAGVAVNNAVPPPSRFANTTFRDGIENSFAVGNSPAQGGSYPLYVPYEDYSTGVDNVLLTASYDGGATWTSPIQVNENIEKVDEFQPNATVASNGTLSVNFYDRRLACPLADDTEASGAGIALDPAAPYGATNYCVNASIQFYDAALHPLTQNIRLTQHTWDPQLNAPHTGSPSGTTTFIGDYFGNITSSTDTGSTDFSTFTSTYNDGSNPEHRQQQVVATVAVP